MRHLLTWDYGQYRMAGTAHIPDVDPLDAALGGPAPKIGFLFLNPGHLPRDGHAGLMVRLADEVCQQGHHAFRFDLPGLGDSEGLLPRTTAELFVMMHSGWFVEPALTLLRGLPERYGLDRMVVSGLCGGAGTALLAAAQVPELIAGVLAFEPEFFHPHPEKPVPPWRATLTRAGWLRFLSGQSRFSERFGMPRPELLELLGTRLLPPITDTRLVIALRDLAARGTPVATVMAGGQRRNKFLLQVCAVLFPYGIPAHLSVLSIPKTNHIFTTGGGRHTAIEAVTAWCRSTFPLSSSTELLSETAEVAEEESPAPKRSLTVASRM